MTAVADRVPTFVGPEHRPLQAAAAAVDHRDVSTPARDRGADRACNGQRRALLRDDELWQAIEDTARHVHPYDPLSLTRGEFNDHKAAAGWGDAPEAKQVQRRLLPIWGDLLAVACDPGRDRARSKSQQRRAAREALEVEMPDFTPAICIWALQAVWRMLSREHPDGDQFVMRKADYDREVRAAAARADRALPMLGVPLPGGDVVMRVLGCTWVQALERTGLPHEQPTLGTQALTVAEAIEIALNEKGALPTRPELDRFATANDLAVAKTRGKYVDILTALRADRAARGLDTPLSAPPADQRPDWDEPVGRRLGPPRGRVRLDDDQKLDVLIAFLDHLDTFDRVADRQPTSEVYDAWSDGHGDRPSRVAIVGEGGSFDEMVREASRLRRHPELRQRSHPVRHLLDRALGDTPLRLLAYAYQHGSFRRPDAARALDAARASVNEQLDKLVDHGGLLLRPHRSGDRRLERYILPDADLPADVLSRIAAVDPIEPGPEPPPAPQSSNRALMSTVLEHARQLGDPFYAPELEQRTGIEKSKLHDILKLLVADGHIRRGDKVDIGQPGAKRVAWHFSDASQG